MNESPDPEEKIEKEMLNDKVLNRNKGEGILFKVLKRMFCQQNQLCI